MEDPKIRAMDAKEIQLLGRMLYPLVYLDQSNSDDENLTMMDYISEKEEKQPEYIAEVSANEALVNNLLSKLPEDEKAFIMLQFGMVDGKQRDKRSMASSIRRMSESEIQKKTEQILDKLRKLGLHSKANLGEN